MKNADIEYKRRVLPGLALALAALALAILFLALPLAPSARAAGLKQVGCFAGNFPGLAAACKPKSQEEAFGEEVQLGGVGGMAVNYTGAGGVPEGTVYAFMHDATYGTSEIGMFEPEGEGLKFVESWSVVELEEPYAVCGPVASELPNGSEPGEHNACQPSNRSSAAFGGLAVDQANGNVYSLSNNVLTAGRTMAVEYSATGGEVIARFGERAPESQSIAESPAKIHGVHSRGAIAVTDAGRVYVYDNTLGGAAGFHQRLMVFEPQGGIDFAHYVYAGEVLEGDLGEVNPTGPVTDAAGNLYVGGGSSSSNLKEYEASALIPGPYPTPAPAPACAFSYAPGGIVGATVDPLDGEVFFSSIKRQGSPPSHYLYRLGPCDPVSHEFAESGEGEIQKTAFGPERADLEATAYDPGRTIGVHPAGALYAGAPSELPEIGPGEPGQGSLGYVFATPAEIAPEIAAESFSHVTSTTAAPEALIEPHGSATRYVFQYETEANYQENEPADRFAGAAEAPPGGALAGEGTEAVSVSASLAGLRPDTRYRFRVLATSHCSAAHPEKLCEAEGQTIGFATFPSEAPGLPDHRVYELVSPPQKSGGQVIPDYPTITSCQRAALCKPGSLYGRYPVQSAPSGDAIAYEGTDFGSESGPVVENEYLARRTAAGWQSTDLSPTGLDGRTGGYRAFSAALSRAVLDSGNGQAPLGPDAPGEYRDLYAQPSEAPLSLTSLLEAGQAFQRLPTGPEKFEIQYAGASADLSRIFFSANDALTAEVPGVAPAAPAVSSGESDLYEWHEGRLALVNVAPGNTTAITSPSPTLPGPSAHPVSADGSRVFFADGSHQLYVRITGAETAETLPVSESRRSTPDPLGTRPASFLAAVADGARVLFSSPEELTDDANTGFAQEIVLQATAGTFTLTFEGQTTSPISFQAEPPAIESALDALSTIGKENVSVAGGKEGKGKVVTFTGALATSEKALSADGSGLTGTVSLRSFRPGADLYEWRGGALTDLTAGQGSYAFQGLVGQSEDLSHFYFVDTGVLAANEGAVPDSEGHPEFAEAGKDNLYSWTGETGTNFVTRLSSADETSAAEAERIADWESQPALRTAEASPDGRYLAFLSTSPLTGYDNTGPCAGNRSVSAIAPGPCSDVFLYDSATGRLSCPSCNPSGESPLGRSYTPRIEGGLGLPQPRYLTDEGRLYFDSQDSLVPADTNGVGGEVGVEDVYQYEPAGIGTCARDAGCLSLISAGTGSADSNFLAIDPSGKNVFFTTRDQLALKDRDDAYDLYDAREGGGIGAETEVARSECQGEACQPPVSAPDDPTPGSSSFEGAGNVREAKARQHRQKHHKHHTRKHKQKTQAKGHGARADRNHGGAK